MREDYSLEACYRSVTFAIERLGNDPVRLLGEYTLRAAQDCFFNKTMIEAALLYIERHDIKWNEIFPYGTGKGYPVQ